MTLERRKIQNREIRDSINASLHDCSKLLKNNFEILDISSYKYSSKEAMEELGLDDELIHSLLEDYVIQIIKSKAIFLQYINELETSTELNYTSIRELTHKNLGVAKNLRIEDGIKILSEIMKQDDLSYLRKCIEALEFCAIRLKPNCAYKTLQLIKVKDSL